MIVMLSLTVKQVEQDEFAVSYDNYTMEFDEIYDQGTHVIGAGEKLIRVKRTLQEYQATVNCLTLDKVLVDLDVAAQYQFREDELIPFILRKFKNSDNYKTFLTNRMLSAIYEVCTAYNAEEFYTSRGTIDIAIYNSMEREINQQDIGSDVALFQLVGVYLPSEFVTAIEDKQATIQLEETANNDRPGVLTAAETVLLETQQEAEVTLINANKTAAITLDKALREAAIEENLWKERSIGYENAKDELGLDVNGIIEYIRSDAVRQASKIYTTP